MFATSVGLLMNALEENKRSKSNKKIMKLEDLKWILIYKKMIMILMIR